MFLRLQQKAVPESKASPLGNCAHTTPQRPRMRHWPWFSDENMLLVSEKGWVVPSGASGKEPACQCRGLKRHRFDPWVGKFPCRRAWQSTPVFLLGESHGQRSLAGYSPQDCKELDTTEATQRTKRMDNWASLDSQWLGLHATSGSMGLISGRGTRILHATQHGLKN